MMILGQVASTVVSLIGRAMAEGDYEKARNLRQQAINEYGPDIVPALERAEAQEVGPTEFGQAQEDDSLRARQLKAMSELDNVYAQEGNTAADQAAMGLARQQVAGRAGQDYANTAAMMARRGQRGSGLEAALYSQTGQDSANALGGMAMQNQIAARDRALRALESGARLSGDVRGQDYRALSDKARAQDAINQFNAQQRAGAQRQNISSQQWTADFDMTRRNNLNRARGDLASDYTGSAQRTQQTAAGVGQAASNMGSTAGKGASDEAYLEWLEKNGGGR